jgi:F0F1-type ATP synthase assembly protein I
MESKQSVSDDQKAPDTEHTGVMLATIGDTTWRMFVPSIGCTLLGVWADRHFGVSPWLMITGIVLGFFGAFLLVKKQLSDIAARKGAHK